MLLFSAILVRNAAEGGKTDQMEYDLVPRSQSTGLCVTWMSLFS
jgi:hypothetical protein